jgi:SAM-dependent methyltransferase
LGRANRTVTQTQTERAGVGGTVGAMGYERFPPGFFARADESPDAGFYSFDRLLTHIDDGAIVAVGELYDELGLTGDVLDICSSWISHFRTAPRRLVAMGMNETELRANGMAASWAVRDLNVDPSLPFGDASFDAVTCCVSVDYLVRPLEVFAEAARVLRLGGVFVLTFSNRCFPTKAIRGWLMTDDRGHCAIVDTYFDLTEGFEPAVVQHRNPGARTDPLYAVFARRR